MSILKLKTIVIFLSDVIALYFSLIVSLLLKYGLIKPSDLIYYFNLHVVPFSIIFVAWLFVFYLFDLYKEKYLVIKIKAFNVFTSAVLLNLLLTALYFYLLMPIFQITPKTNLIIFGIVFITVGSLIRIGVMKIFTAAKFKNNIILIGNSPSVEESVQYIEKNPQLRCEIKQWFKDGLTENEIDTLTKIIRDEKVDMVIVQSHLIKKDSIAKIVYRILPMNVKIFDFVDFYESVFRRVPVEELEERWFIEEITMGKHIYDVLKKFLDVLLSSIALILFFPLMLFIMFLIKLTSKGPVFYSQTRVGKNGKQFKLYKFRTMIQDAEKSGPRWAGEKDPRITFVGKILRRTHLDELPQLINVIKGDSSLVGPRPERPEFVEELEKKVPYYEVRHLIRPGITGWAQINYRYAASIEDSYKKLQYDIFYLKNRSLTLDLIIILNTAKFLFKRLK